MGAEDALSLAVGSLQIVLALVAFRHLSRFGRTFPWLAALMVYFATRGADELYVGLGGRHVRELQLASDALLAVVLVLLALGLRRTVAGLAAAVDEAQIRAREYDRALHDYTRLVRHRLANPLMSVQGAAATLRARRRQLAPEQEDELLTVLVEATQRLEQLSLDPTELTAEEHELEPTPRRPHPSRPRILRP